jgi:hypothetical protein
MAPELAAAELQVGLRAMRVIAGEPSPEHLLDEPLERLRRVGEQVASDLGRFGHIAQLRASNARQHAIYRGDRIVEALFGAIRLDATGNQPDYQCEYCQHRSGRDRTVAAHPFAQLGPLAVFEGADDATVSERPQVVAHGFYVGVALPRIAGHCAFADRTQLRRRIWREVGDGGRRSLCQTLDDGPRVFALFGIGVRRVAHRCVVEDRTDRVDICLAADFVAAHELLRRHVGGRTEHVAFLLDVGTQRVVVAVPSRSRLAGLIVFDAVAAPDYLTSQRVYVATDGGVFVSNDGATTFQPLAAPGLPNPVTKLELAGGSSGDLYAMTGLAASVTGGLYRRILALLGGVVQAELPLPSDPALTGATLRTQTIGVEFGAGGAVLQLTGSNALDWTVGAL